MKMPNGGQKNTRCKMSTVEKDEQSNVTKKEEVQYAIDPNLDGTIRAANLTYTDEEKEAMLLRFKEEGCVPENLYLWKEKKILLWDYTKYEMAVKHGIKYDTVEKSFATMADALAFVAEQKIAIPTISLFEKILTARQFGEYWQEKLGKDHPVCVAAAQKNNGILDDLGIVGVKAGVCRSTVNKVNRILDSKKEDLIEKCRHGELSISAAYDSLKISEDTDPDNLQKEVKDEEVIAAEQKRLAKSKNNELKSLAYYSVMGFKNG